MDKVDVKKRLNFMNKIKNLAYNVNVKSVKVLRIRSKGSAQVWWSTSDFVRLCPLTVGEPCGTHLFSAVSSQLANLHFISIDFVQEISTSFKKHIYFTSTLLKNLGFFTYLFFLNKMLTLSTKFWLKIQNENINKNPAVFFFSLFVALIHFRKFNGDFLEMTED